jgi:hypothetical protein
VSKNLKNGLFRGEIFFSRKKNHPSEGQFFKNDKMCNSYGMSQDLFQQGWKATKKGKKTDKIKKFFTSPCFLGSGIRDPGSGMGKNPDPGSGINIPDSQHCLKINWLLFKQLGNGLNRYVV